jgi:hypothetical protein
MDQDVKVPPTAIVEGVKPEPAASPTEEAKPKEVPQDSWAQLARKEKALRYQARQLQQQQKAFQEQQAKVVPQQDWKERIKSDAIGMLAEAGLSHEDLTQLVLNSKPEDIQLRQLKAEMQSIKDSQKNTLSQVEQSQKQAYNQAIKQLTREVKMLVDGNDAYETIGATGSQSAVVALIEQTYKEDGILLSAEEASSQVEDYLVEEALNLSKLKKIQSKLSPPVVEQPQKTTPSQKTNVQTKTLTNAITQRTTTPSSAKALRERAIAAFNGQLKG